MRPVLRQNSMRTENSAIPCRDDCPIQVLPHPPERQDSLPDDRPRGVPVYFRDATLVRIRQPDRTGGAALPVAHEKRRSQPFPS